MIPGSYPSSRPRRLRAHDWLRAMVTEHTLEPRHLIWPLFVHEGDAPEPVSTMPGVFRWPLTQLAEQAKLAESLGIPAVALFPVVPISRKTADGKEAWHKNNLMARAIAAIKAATSNLGVIADVALDPYTSHGHDGLLGRDGQILNDETVQALCKQAVHLAKAGADVVAPSDMMDGRIAAIRAALDAKGYAHTAILSYAVKYASAFYGPFRDAVGSSGSLKGASKATYQMNPANIQEALKEARMDIAEGADMLMVKPGMPYLDVLAQVSAASPIPVLAYQVSGEYAMIHAAAAQGMLDADRAMMESLLAFRRAGAQAIFTYAAPEIARTLKPTSSR
jgi:porphobilinogen synthase